MQSWNQQLRFAARQLWRNPGFTLAVVLTVALSVGANTAAFSLLNALVFEPLPYPHPERIGTIYERVIGTKPVEDLTGIDDEKWELLRDNVPAVLSAAFANTSSGVNLQLGSHAEYVREGRISARYLEVLGLQPTIGRNFADDVDLPYGPKEAILSYNLWHNTFGADATVLGHSILLRGKPYSVLAVLPPGIITPLNADVYVPLQPSREGEGVGTNYGVITRLRNGVTRQQADAEINRAWARVAREFEKNNVDSQISYNWVPLQKSETDSLRPQAMLLMVATGFILLIACANLSGLSLVRILRRTSEVATRLALGASPWQIQKQFWIENLVLAIIGGVSAIAIGLLAVRILVRALPDDFSPVMHISLDAHVTEFTLAVTLLASILFGMLPALVTRKVDLRSSMAFPRISGHGSGHVRTALVAGEIALTVVLLTGTGVLIHSLIHLETLPKGFNPSGVIVAKASLDDVRFHNPALFRSLLDESIARMREIPGVVDAAVGLSVPYERTLNGGVTLSDGKDAGQEVGTDINYVTPGYFNALQLHVLAGRVFADSDGPNAQHVAIVNQSFARKFYGGINPVGHHINKDVLIVGEVADVPISSGLYEGAPLSTEQELYIPAAQVNAAQLSLWHVWFQPDWIVRTRGNGQWLVQDMELALISSDFNLPTSGFFTMKDLLAHTLVTQRIESGLLGAIAALALLLGAIGVFALVANMVTQRTREIAIRMAVGSTVGGAILHVVRSAVSASLLGTAIGMAISAGTLRVMRNAVYGVGVYDAPTLAIVIIVVILTAILAAMLPALRIAQIDPASTLRAE